MGPPPFGDGNGSTCSSRCWARTAFNGATAFRRWKLWWTVRETRSTPTFNGATAFRRWKRVQPAQDGLNVVQPSMGPPPFGDGNSPEAARVAALMAAFNGATAFRRWKLVIAFPPLGRRATFNGATAFRRWKLGGMDQLRPQFIPFNGATAFRRWKLEGAVGQTQGARPSMGPPPFGDGNARIPRPPRGRSRPFNGATAFRRWKRRTAAGSHRCGCTFNGATAFRRWKPHRPGILRQLLHRPSMGPPPFGDGNFVQGYILGRRFVPSMGPPPFGDGNVLELAPDRVGVDGLQWGHRLSAMETRSIRLSAVVRWAFNGATAFRRWKRRHVPGSGLEATFNGATAFRRWKRHLLPVVDTVADLQWGHRLSAMETAPGRGCPLGLRRPSMGPPPFGDGNCSLWLTSVMDSCKSALFHKDRLQDK